MHSDKHYEPVAVNSGTASVLLACVAEIHVVLKAGPFQTGTAEQEHVLWLTEMGTRTACHWIRSAAAEGTSLLSTQPRMRCLRPPGSLFGLHRASTVPAVVDILFRNGVPGHVAVAMLTEIVKQQSATLLPLNSMKSLLTSGVGMAFCSVLGGQGIRRAHKWQYLTTCCWSCSGMVPAPHEAHHSWQWHLRLCVALCAQGMHSLVTTCAVFPCWWIKRVPLSKCVEQMYVRAGLMDVSTLDATLALFVSSQDICMVTLKAEITVRVLLPVLHLWNVQSIQDVKCLSSWSSTLLRVLGALQALLAESVSVLPKVHVSIYGPMGAFSKTCDAVEAGLLPDPDADTLSALLCHSRAAGVLMLLPARQRRA